MYDFICNKIISSKVQFYVSQILRVLWEATSELEGWMSSGACRTTMITSYKDTGCLGQLHGIYAGCGAGVGADI